MVKKNKNAKKNAKAAFDSDQDDDKYDLKLTSPSHDIDTQDLTLSGDEEPQPKAKKSAPKVASGFDLLAADDAGEPTTDPESDSAAFKPADKKKKKEKGNKRLLSSQSLNQGDAEEEAPSSPTGTGQLAQELGDVSLGSKSKDKKKEKKKKKTLLEDEPEFGASSGAKVNARAFADADEADDEKKPDGHFNTQSEHLTATGILLSHERSKDIQIDKFTVAAYGQQLVSDTTLNILYGHRYGLVGNNGCGKSTLLRALAHREVPIQNSVELYLLEKEYDATDLTAVEAVVDIVKTERDTLEEELDELLGSVEGAESARCDFVQDRLQELDLSFAEQKARSVLHGLGFTEEMQDMKTREFSGGWRMRVALARALFVKPTVLLLDDATNHLDLSAVVWLEDYLLSYPHTIIMVSHSQDFLNSICTDIMYLANRKLDYYSGDYDNFLKVKEENDESTKKKLKADEKKLKRIKENLGRSGAQAKQAKSQEKAMQKRQAKEGGPSVEEAARLFLGDKKLEFDFQECGGGLPSPFLKFNDVSFHYPGRPFLFKKLNFGIDLDSRVALVGPNGVGKSTLMKLMCGTLEPVEGSIYKHHHLRIARFHQHLTEQLILDQSAVEWMCAQFPGIKFQDMRGIVGRFGLTGKSQTCAMEQLSDGQRRRVVFAWLSQKNCHLLMLDEPTNFLDAESIDALAEGIDNFDGGVVVISHDFRLIDKIAQEIWVIENGELEEWEGDIREYKEALKQKVTQQ